MHTLTASTERNSSSKDYSITARKLSKKALNFNLDKPSASTSIGKQLSVTDRKFKSDKF
jgi:hypothetical protein